MNAHTGRELWKQLHEIPLAGVSFQEYIFPLWMESVKALLECPSCFRKIIFFLRKWPVEYGEGFDLWAKCLHDYVNKELGKPLFFKELTLEPLKERGIVQ